jgi:hypothetical protein
MMWSTTNLLSRFMGEWFVLVNGFIDHLYTPFGTTSNYSAIANLHSLQITTAHAKSQTFLVLLSRCLVTALNNGDSSASVLIPLLLSITSFTETHLPVLHVEMCLPSRCLETLRANPLQYFSDSPRCIVSSPHTSICLPLLASVRIQNVSYSKSCLNCSWFPNLKPSFPRNGVCRQSTTFYSVFDNFF